MISESTIQSIAKIFCGDIEGYYSYKSGPALVGFFNRYFGDTDRYGQGFPSRWIYTYDKLVALLNAGKFDSFLNLILGKEYIMQDCGLSQVEAAERSHEVFEEFNRVVQKDIYLITYVNGKYKEKRRAELKGKHILMAEDVMINAEIMKQIISMRDAEIDHAENGRIAVAMFEESPVGYYDAILMDVRMPEMDGLEATMAIRALNRPDAKTVPIIAMTANAFDEDVQRSLQVGMNAHLSKPVEPERLYQTLEELIWESDMCQC